MNTGTSVLAARDVGRSTSETFGFRTDVQGLRAVAVLAVIVYHAAGLLPGGFVGVDVFFVISGFVITGSLTRESARDGRISLVGFYRRRVHRLTPALTTCLVVVIPLSLLLAPLAAVRTTVITGIAASLLSANIALAEGPGYFDLGAESNPLAHTWSLSLEEQFYLVFPALVIGLVAIGARRGGTRRALTVGLGVAGIVSLVACLLAANANGDVAGIAWGRVAFFAMPLRAWQFIGGAMIALAVRHVAGRLGQLVGTAGIAMIMLSFVVIEEAPYPTAWALVPTIGTMLVLAAPTSAVADALRWRALVRMGDVSYSWYLWHWPAIVFFRVNGVESQFALLAIGLATYPIAVLSYRFIEQRFRPVGRSSRRSWVRIAAVSVAATMIVATVTLAGFGRARDQAIVQAAYGAGEGSLAATCPRLELAPAVTGCTFGSGSRRIALVGDSNAAQFTGAVVAAASAVGASTTLVSEQGCPMLDVVVSKLGEVDPACQRYVAAALPWVVAQGFDVVVLSNAFDMYLQVPDEHVASAPGGAGLDGADAYVEALARFVDELERNGSQVVLVHPIPKPAVTQRGRADFRTGAGCSLLGVLAGDADVPLGCRDGFSRSGALARQRIAIEAERAAAAGSGAVLLDPFPTVCSTDRCRAYDRDEWIYQDYGHVTPRYSDATLTSLFEDAFKQAIDE